VRNSPLAAFNRWVIVTPDLISRDKDRLNADLQDAFPRGGQAATVAADTGVLSGDRTASIAQKNGGMLWKSMLLGSSGSF
jgi:hypothetical protein